MFNFFSKADTPKPIETAIIHYLTENLSPDKAEMVRIQFSLIEKFKRTNDSKEVVFSYKKGDLFPVQYEFKKIPTKEYTLAALTVGDISTGNQAKCHVKIIDGKLSSFVFDTPPGNIDTGVGHIKIVGNIFEW